MGRISNARFIPQANTVQVHFGNMNQEPSFTYIPQSNPNTGSVITFPNITNKTTKNITSTPTYIAAEETTVGTLKIDELVIYAVLQAAPIAQPLPINKEINIPNVKIKPGHRYNLILNYEVPCVQVIEYTESKFAWFKDSGDVQP